VKPQEDLAPTFRGQEERAVELGAVNCEVVDLLGCVAPRDHPVSRSSIRVEPCYDDISAHGRPLALDPKQSRAKIEDQVVPFVVQRLAHADSEPNACRDHRCLGDQSFLVRRQH